MFKGSIVAIVTPFKEGRVDEKTLRELVEFRLMVYVSRSWQASVNHVVIRHSTHPWQ